MGDAERIHVVESGTERAESGEYEFALEAWATIDGPDGELIVRRRYEALPYHNDDLYPEGADSNDRRTARPHEVHVHTRFRAATGDRSEYVGDEHDSWAPDPSDALADPSELTALCSAHHLADPVALYRDGMDRQ